MQHSTLTLIMHARIASLHLHPIKSCRAVDSDVARLDRHGLADDRVAMVVDANGKFISQRSHPTLARVVVTPQDSGLLVSADHSATTLFVPRPTTEATLRRVTVWGDTVDARSAGAAAADFFSTMLGEACELVFASAETERLQNNEWTDGTPVAVNFQDGYPILVCNRASLAALQERLPQPLPMTRFRPNIVLDGLEAFAEDTIDELQIGAVTLRLAKPCTRCGITGIDQTSGERANEPLTTLREFRYDARLKGVTFGWNAVVVHGAGLDLRVGDTVTVRRRAAPAK